MSMKTILMRAASATKKAAPEILTGLGTAGLIFSLVSAIHATPKAYDLMRERLYDEHDVDVYNDTEVSLHVKNLYAPIDVVKTCWRVYIPTVISATLGIGCIIFSDILKNKRMSALVAAYDLTERYFHNYTTKVIDTIGEDKEKEIRQKICKDEIAKHPISEQTIAKFSSGGTLCFDTLTGRYFWSDPDAIRRVENKINLEMREEMTYSINELYSEFGLDEVAIGHSLGWDIDGGYVSIIFDTQLTEDDRPCLALSYSRLPRNI